jgi:superfamily II DNA or RNA helicase
VQLDLFTPPKPKKLARVTPRDYQEAGIVKTFELWGGGSVGVLFRQPTGTGKTISGSLIADQWLAQGDNYRVLILAHERQLIQQFADEIEWVLGDRPKIEMGNEHCTGKERIIVASRQTLFVKGEGEDAISRLYKFDPKLNWLLVIDEAHRWARKLKSCRPIIEYFEQNPNHRRLGLTATPERTDKTTLAGLFPTIASDYRLFDVDGGRSAVNDGWAVPYDQRFITVEGVNFKNIKEIAKDFDKKELELILGESETLAKLCTPLLDLVGSRRTIIFNPGTAMAKNVALYINEKLNHEAAVSLDGSFPDDDRKAIYKRHQKGEFQFLSVCGLCREGYNDPGIQAVAIFRPTKSRPLAEQMKGRGCRPLKGVVSTEMSNEERRAAIARSTKPNCMIVDLVGVTGIADCASTASIMAASKPDEVINRANANMLKKPSTEAIDVAEEIRHAEEEIAAEKEAARKAFQEAQEKREKAKAEQEERRKREREEMAKRARLDAEVSYTERKVSSGHGSTNVKQSAADLATVGQQKYMYVLGMRGDFSQHTKKQASRMIGQLKGGADPAYVAKVNPPPGSRKKNDEPKQLNIDDINSLFMEAGRG